MTTQLIPTRRILWAEADRKTLRLTGKTQFALPNALPPGDVNDGDTEYWVALDPALGFTLMNGSQPWGNYAKIGPRVMQVDADLDLGFLTHISPQAWPEIASTLDPKWTSVPYIPLDIPRIEPDDWDLFWKLWDEKNADITRGLNETQYWKGLCCWLNPAINTTMFNYSNTVVDDWSMHFPKMFEQIRNCLPFHSIEKIVLWANINEVAPHFDPDAVIYPWPDSLRIMLWDTNEQATFWMSRWPKRTAEFNPASITTRNKGAYGVKAERITQQQKMYVELPKDTNTFVFNNGAFLHGADLAKPKIIMAIKGRPKVYDWIKAIEPSYQKYKDFIPKC